MTEAERFCETARQWVRAHGCALPLDEAIRGMTLGVDVAALEESALTEYEKEIEEYE